MIRASYIYCFMDKTVSTSSKFTFIGNYKYDQDHLLGSGFESQVYRAHHRIKKHDVAMKVVDVEKLGEGINRKLFESELRCLEELKGTPHILNLHEVIRKEDKIYVITELCFGDLSSRKERKLAKQEAWGYIQQAIKGYKYLYEKDIVHRDLKPVNLFFNTKKEIKIGDFGFAAKNFEVRKQSNYNIGSPGYMAPETVKRNTYSHASDIWSIGIIYYELLTGTIPWKGKTEQEIEQEMTEENLKSYLIRPEIDPESKAFLQRILHFSEFERMKPEDLFEYQFGMADKIDITINGLKVENFDNLSTTTADNAVSIKQIPVVKNFWKEFEGKEESDQNSFNTSLPNRKEYPKLKSYENREIAKTFTQIPSTPSQRPNRLNPSLNNIFGPAQLGTKTPKTACEPTLFCSSFKKKRKSHDTMKNIEKEKEEEAFKLESLFLNQLKLLESLTIFFQHIDLVGFNDRWNSELNLMKVCLKNLVVSLISNFQNGVEYFEKIAGAKEVKKYISSSNYEKNSKIFMKYEEAFRKDAQFEKQWAKVREQNLGGAINSIISFILALKPTLLDSKRYTLQIVIACCQVVEKVYALSKMSFLQSGSHENIFESLRVLRKKDALQAIEKAILLKPAF